VYCFSRNHEDGISDGNDASQQQQQQQQQGLFAL